MHIAKLDVCSILVLTITRSSGVIRDQLVSLALPTENKLLEAYHNGVKSFLKSHVFIIIFSSYFLAARYYWLKVCRFIIYRKFQEINIFEIKDQLVSPCWEQTTGSLSQRGPIFSETPIICNFIRHFLICQIIIDWKFWKTYLKLSN